MRPGVLNVDKPAGATSFTVVRQLRELTRARRVGHAGTLDPLATGVLPILFESATRLSDFAHGLEKTYEADVHLGFSTPTDDAETEPEPVASPAELTAEPVASALQTFVGRVRQEPPAFSAVKVDGKRAYKRARDGDQANRERDERRPDRDRETGHRSGVGEKVRSGIAGGRGHDPRHLVGRSEE